jgi:hypothetical protein
MDSFKHLVEAFKEEPTIEKRNKLTPWDLPLYKKYTEKGISAHVSIKEGSVSLQFLGWEVVLKEDGTYIWGDTSG